ncbi:MAG: cobyrinate a,c-diamide synthase [Parasporobacterium sp.]|nr:cobyrinate a,c-diamide synthase [Parasporobacterium sp.]
MIAGTNSGCGKTTITCSILQALINRGLKAGAFKCGPDYIDPMFHSRIIGAKASNLDSFFFSENTLNYLLAENSAGCDINIIEGVMGYYDGMGIDTTRASSCEIAGMTRSPVILAVNAKGASLSILAQISGFLHFSIGDKETSSGICGVILNQCTSATYAVLETAIRRYFNGQAEPLGYLPVLKECSLESRHLGLVTAGEIKDLREKMQILAQQAERTIELDRILQIAGDADSVHCEAISLPQFEQKIRVAVARDRAFCFYYEDSLDLLRKMGAELVPFSPLSDEALPSDVDGLYLGGGYPELYSGELASNHSMRQSVYKALVNGIPCIAECGGYMYLTEKIGSDPMVGYIRGNSFDTGKLSRFGYVTLTAEKDNLLCRKGQTIPAHEFHHWDSEDPGNAFTAAKSSGRSWSCVHASGRLYAGYPHFHFYANPAFGENFYRTCLEYRKENHLS